MGLVGLNRPLLSTRVFRARRSRTSGRERLAISSGRVVNVRERRRAVEVEGADMEVRQVTGRVDVVYLRLAVDIRVLRVDVLRVGVVLDGPDGPGPSTSRHELVVRRA
jgi:hypothetical protein